jgi:hypothetical protein
VHLYAAAVLVEDLVLDVVVEADDINAGKVCRNVYERLRRIS